MVRYKFFLVFPLFLPFVCCGKNVDLLYIEDDCFENKSLESNSTDLVGVTHQPQHDLVLSRVKRSFGGQEPVNLTLINANVLGPNGWLPLACGAPFDLLFHVTGYTVLGIFILIEFSKNNFSSSL